MVVKRETWNPILLSRWYMPFLDSRRGNRTCWLDRPMVSDAHRNYRVPLCDSRGLCDPLEPDNDTVSACEVNENGEISLGCPVVCDNPCFGPICYRLQSDMFTLSTAIDRAPGVPAYEQSMIQVTKSPRILSKVYSLSESDMHESLASVRNLTARSFELLQRGETVLRNILATDAAARKHIAKVQAETEGRSSKTKCGNCERVMGRSQFMAAASIVFSALTCPILIAVIIKLKSRANTEAVSVRTSRSIKERLL
ncbi:hypothetical protein DPEC_G00070980 [Dallia pectoralis]|uniref:Uncharacterized protein n=1 Tax=Dallia pectoralis TaxID=75939 RepID=A0ACC2H2E9_DALPE|nr:hypothetical protein DPEC_G00070980 [Dallia pectoralis]